MPDIDPILLRETLSQYASQGRTALLPALHAVQTINGYLPETVAAEIGRTLGVPAADVYGVIKFYNLFYHEPVGKNVVQICTDLACAMAGGEEVLQAVRRHLDISGEMTTAGDFTVIHTTCLGMCEHAPAMLVGQTAIGRVDARQAAELCQGHGYRPRGLVYGDQRRLTGNCGKGRPTTLVEYEASGGYRALRKAIQQTSSEVINEVKASGLVGRGGAAFPTGVKWEGAAQAAGETKYLICNADESEPGTFKDRVMLEEDPQRMLEGLVIAAYAVGASKGYIYLRGEYPNAHKSLTAAIQEARQAGYIGENVLGTGFSFEVDLRVGAGAYICGEETALFEAIEGKRGYPRLKPPFPTTHGLFGQPTAINNVETLCNVPFIVEHGAAAYRQLGTEKSPGTKLFCLSGDVSQPGLYETAFGVSLRYLLDELAGGVRGGRKLQAILFGGAAGAFATPDQLDSEMSFEGLKASGLPLGSGVVLVIDETRDLRQVLLGLGRFFSHESCGKCFPCQIGTRRQLEILERIAGGRTLPGDAQRLSDVGLTMTDASLCGLGQTAASAVLSALRIWPEIFN